MTATITISEGVPSAHYPEPERARNGATDYTVAIVSGAASVTGEITLYRGADGRMSAGGTHVDVWCSSSVVAWLGSMDRQDREAAVAALESGQGTYDVEVAS